MAEGSNYRRLLRVEPLEDRRMLANVTVSNLNDVVNGNTASIPLLIANPGADGISLREAITAANADVAADTINFSVNGNINLSSTGQLSVTRSLTINGPGAFLLTIRAYDPSGAVGDGRRVFNIDDGAAGLINVTINDVTITGGDLGLNQVGGGIQNREILTIADSTISNNRTRHVGGGIGSNSAGNLTISNCTITGNSASNQLSLYGGGGVYAGPSVDGAPGSLLIITSNINNNSAGIGGGVSAFVPTIIGGCTVTGNTAALYGGGAFGTSNQPLTITGSAITGNSAVGGGGGVYSLGVNISYSSISGNSVTGALGTGGGGVGGAGAISSSTISGNTSADVGGGVSGSFDIVNSTLSGNSAAIAGGGVHRDVLQNMVIRHSTISGNTAPASFGSGIFSPGVNNGFKVRLQSSIVAGNTNSDLDSDGVVTFESLGFNLVGTGSGISAFSAANGDKIGLNPMLGPLANNGGPTFTRAPLPGSPAIDGGNPLAVPGSGTVPVYDQRQAPHSRVQGARIDIGAFESTPVVPSLLGDYNRDGGVNAADYVFWRKTEGTTGLVAFEGADGSGNGTIDPPDRTVWSVNFGRTESGGAEIAGQASDDGTNMRQAVSSLHPRFGETRLHVVESLGNSNAAIGPFLNHAASSRSIANMVWLDYMPRALSPYIGTTEVLDSSSLDDAEPENGLDALDAVFGLLAAG